MGRLTLLLFYAIVCSTLWDASVLAHTSQRVSRAEAQTYFIDPAQGSDEGSGTSRSEPFRTIQHAINKAQPGDRIELLPGEYNQNIEFIDNGGTVNQPIIVEGPRDAIVRGDPADNNNRVISISQDYVTLSGFTINGERTNGTYNEKLIQLEGKPQNSVPHDVRGVRIIGMTLKNAAQECIRLRLLAKENEIAGNTISNCGIRDFKLAPPNAINDKNGEAIYVGTEPDRLPPGVTRDGTSDIWIHHNTIDTQGSECVDIKEGTERTIVENNSCTGSQDVKGGGITVQGNKNIIRYNHTFGHKGTGIRIGGDTATDARNNDIYRNIIENNAVGAIEFESIPQGAVCANSMNRNGTNVIGSKKNEFNPIMPCNDVILSILVQQQ